MPNPTVSFRIPPFQLARGLQIVRNLEPEYKLTSISHLVKVIYFDYIAKMTIGTTDDISTNYLAEVLTLLQGSPNESISLEESILDNAEELKKSNKSILSIPDEPIINKQNESEEKSSISTVTDFSPPTDWKEE